MHELAHGHDGDACVRGEMQQMAISADHAVSPAGDGALEDPVIVGIVRNGVQGEVRFHQVR